MKMKTIRITGIALSMVTLLLVAMAPPASATCPGSGVISKLKGTYAFRLGPAKGFDADLAGSAAGDPGNVGLAQRQDILRVGVFTSDCAGNITYGHTLATTDTNNGDTWLIDFNWTGTYTLNADLTGTLTITPTLPENGCTGVTSSDPGCKCLSPFNTSACVPYTGNIEEGVESYSISVSTSNSTVELSETDNTSGGAKIFMIGQAIKQ